jgi:Family of unknown function (DUF6345)
MTPMVRPGAFVHVVCATLALQPLGCSDTPPSFGETTDLSDTAGIPTTTGETDGGADETGGGADVVVDHRTYFIGESVKFDGGGKCDGDRLNTVTRKLRSRLDDAGWTGLRFVGENSWPEDFQDTTERPNGLDGSFADAHRLAVYAGHGKPGRLQWGRPSPHGECRVHIPLETRLGRFAGDTAAAVMLLSSCTLKTDELRENFEENASRQFFGYHDSPHVASGEPRDVFKRTQDGQSTKDAWLDEMEKNIAPGKQSPVVLTAGVDAFDAIEVHGATNLATGAGFIQNVGEPVDALHVEWLNNGCTPGCGSCSRIAPVTPPMGMLTVGSQVPIVELERPHRSAEELANRAVSLVPLLQDRPVGAAQRTQLDEWAARIVREADITVIVLTGAPRIQLAYDPSTDHLVVDDLDAREAARPGVSEVPDPEQQQADLEVARQVRDEVLLELDGRQDDLLGVPRRSMFSVGTREAATIVSGVSSGSVPFETIFSTFGELAGYPVFGAQLEVGVTRRGELSRIGISAIHATEVSTATVRRAPTEALRMLEADVAARNPRMLRQETVMVHVGFISPEGPSRTALLAPALVVDYVVLYPGDGTDPMVSRRQPAWVSLISDAPAYPRHHPDGAVDDAGDSRHADLDDP